MIDIGDGRKVPSLKEFLDALDADNAARAARGEPPRNPTDPLPGWDPTAEPAPVFDPLLDVPDGKAFSIALLNSREFRQYILNSLTLGTIPPDIITRVMDYGWGRPADRVEHTGKDGQPIETVTEVRRIIVSVPPLHPTIN